MNRVYLYAVVAADGQPPLDIDGIWDDRPEVRIVRADALAAVVSAAPPIEFHALTRENAVRALLAHQRVVESVMRTSVALPVKFGTTLPDDAAVVSMLRRGAPILAAPLAELSQYVQVELVVSWNIDDIVREAAADDAIVRFKTLIASQPGGASHEQRLAIGKMMKAFVDRRRDACRLRIVTAVRGVAADMVENALMDDRMIANLALLMARSAGDELDRQLAELDKAFGERLHFRSVGPLPPYSFATVEVSLPSFEAIDRARRVLSLGERADLAEIKSAFHRQIRQVHPDLARSDLAASAPEGEATRQHEAAKVTDAYKTLLSYADALPSAARDDAAAASDCRFDRGAVEGAILVMVRRQTPSQVEAQS